MSRFCESLFALACTAILALEGAAAHAQAGFGQMAQGARPNFRAPGSYERVSGRSNPALDFFGGSRALQHAPAGRTQPMPQPLPVQTGATVKPYSGVQQAASVTPYLALDQRESDVGLPNYYLFVKPQLDQYSYNQAQQLQMRRMQQQMRRAGAGGIVPRSTSGGMPTTGHSTQFMNNAGYYPGLQK